MRLSLNVPDVDAFDALLDLDPAAMKRLWLTTFDDDTIVFDHVDAIERVVNHRTHQVGLRVVGTHEDTDIDANVVVPVESIADVELLLKATDEYDLGHRCGCVCNDAEDGGADESRRGRTFAFDLGLGNLGDLVDPVAQVIDDLKAHVPSDLAEVIKSKLRHAAETAGIDLTDEDDETREDVTIDGLEELPEELRSYVRDLVSTLDDGNLAGVRVVKVGNPFAAPTDETDVSEGEQDETTADEAHEAPSFEDFATSLIDGLKAMGTKLREEVTTSEDDGESAEATDDVENEAEAEAEDVTPEVKSEDALAEKADKLNAAFGQVRRDNAPAVNDAKAATPEKPKKAAEKSEPKKIIDVKRGEGDRLFTGPNFDSVKNRLGAGRVEKLVKTLEAARDGQKVAVGYRNTGRAGIVRGTGVIEHDFYDQGHRHTAKVGVRTSSFGASIVGPDGEIDHDLMELTLFED